MTMIMITSATTTTMITMAKACERVDDSAVQTDAVVAVAFVGAVAVIVVVVAVAFVGAVAAAVVVVAAFVGAVVVIVVVAASAVVVAAPIC